MDGKEKEMMKIGWKGKRWRTRVIVKKSTGVRRQEERKKAKILGRLKGEEICAKRFRVLRKMLDT